MSLVAQTAIVTGGGSGIGRATVLALANAGANVVVAARTPERIESVAREARDIGAHALPVRTDVSCKADVQNMVDQTLRAFGTVDVLVNSAGVGIHSPLIEIREEDWDTVMAVNLKGVFLCCQAVFPAMMATRSGYIINISSLAGKIGVPTFASYTASKFGLMGLTETIAREGRPYNIRATVVCPGPVSIHQDTGASPHAGVGSRLEVEDVAGVVLFLLSQSLRVDIPEVLMPPLHMELDWHSHRR